MMAAVLACGEGAALSHGSAAALWDIGPTHIGAIHVSVPGRYLRRPGLVTHRRRNLEVVTHRAIPVTTPVDTLIDCAPSLTRDELEAAINEADNHDLVSPPALRAALDAIPPRPGTAILARILDRSTFALTRSRLERLFLRLARRAGLPKPRTQEWVNGFRVDFFWPELGLVVETDGLAYHRTPAQQARDRRRDQVHIAAGLTPLRFSHGQVAYEPAHVCAMLSSVQSRKNPPTTSRTSSSDSAR